MMAVPFNKPYIAGKELDYIAQAFAAGHLSGNGQFTQQAHQWLEDYSGAAKALLTHSCTAALEMAAIFAEVGPGDEVIIAFYKVFSTGKALLLCGAVPVFVHISADTLHNYQTLIQSA